MKIDAGKIYRLKGTVQHYPWGGFQFIPGLLGIDNPANRPFAEYWLGTHPSASSSLILEEGTIPLDKLLAAQPELLGEKVFERFHDLPFLFKVLDVREMLSIQVHPTKAEAEKGFDEEEAKGIDINAPNRNYKDRNHKPEVMIALGDFWLLHGFKPSNEIQSTLRSIPQFRSLSVVFEKGGHKGLYSYVMELPRHEVDAIMLPLIQQELKQHGVAATDKKSPGYWVSRYYRNRELKNIDRGTFAIYFLNIVHLQRGEAIFQAAGVPHAYLEGQNIELMSNSDNVLRGGLTNKHVDVPELIKHTRFEAVEPAVLRGVKHNDETRFAFPVDDFMLASIDLQKDERHCHTSQSAEIILCMEGEGNISSSNSIELRRGDACIVFAGNSYTITTGSHGRFFKAMAG